MRAYLGLAGGLLLLACLTAPASAQQMITSQGTSSVPSAKLFTATPSIFSNLLAKPSFSAFQSRPTYPVGPNLTGMLPTFPNLQNTMLLRNVFGPHVQTQVVPPPKKKKN